MAEFPSPGDGPRHVPPDRPDSVIALISETLGEDKRTKNLIRVVWAVGALVAAAFYMLAVLTKGMHGLENPATWIPGGAVGGTCLVRIFIWVRRLRNASAVSHDAVDGKQPKPPPAEQSRTQALQEHIPRQARQSTRQRKPTRKR